MGKLADMVLGYLQNTPSEQLRKDWEELKHYNTQGPNIMDVISNYGRGTIVLKTPLLALEERVPEVRDEFPTTYTSSDLCLAA